MCWLDPNCKGIMYQDGWADKNKGVKMCSLWTLIDKPEHDWSIFRSCYICDEPKECTNSSLLAFVPANNMNDCMEKCRKDETCQYGTFRSDKKLCFLFQTCINLQDNESCPTCRTSSPKCQV